MRRPLSGRALLFAIGLLALGCGGPREPQVAGKSPVRGGGSKPIRLGAVLPMFNHPFFVAQKEGLEEQARKLGATIDVRDGQDDDQKQISQVLTLVNQGYDAIILCPRDEDALVAAVEDANRAGIPILTMNRRVNGGKVIAYVGADDTEGGRKQGETLAAALGPQGGKIIYLEGTQGSSPQRSRGAGFRTILAKHPEITIADDRFADFQEDRAKALMTDLVRRFRPGEIAAIVAQADEMALPAAEVARAEGWSQVKVIGFNGIAPAFDAVRSGLMYATILQDAAEQGRLAVATTVDYLQGKPIKPEVLTELPIITRETVDRFKPAF